ncbi:MAG: histidine ammonia-lyase [Thermoplasmata archaeon]
MTEPLAIDGRSLTLEGFLAVARANREVALDPGARTSLERSRRAVEEAVRRGAPIYGVTTGFGALSHQRIDLSETLELQRALVASHASGVGPPLPSDVVRGMMLLRANSLARGHSGVRPVLVEQLLTLLNRELVPRIPEAGSVGASGDLAPLAHLAEALIGTGSFLRADGTSEPAANALAGAGLGPLTLQAKEGLALVNGTALMASYLALSIEDARGLLDGGLMAAAMSYDALEGSPESLDDRLGEVRDAPEERWIAASMRGLLEESELAVPRSEWRGQDPYTLRCIPQVLASVRHALNAVTPILTGELNAATDNPIGFEDGSFVSGGNFHGQSLAWALDALAPAVHTIAAFSERRISRLLHPLLSRGLPAFLAARPGLSSGFMIPHTVAAALVSENATLVHPASAYSLPTSADQEDFVSMGAWAGAKLRRILMNSTRVIAIEWIVAGQALELRHPKRGGRGSEAALRALRSHVPAMTADRTPAPDIDRVVSELSTGRLQAATRALRNA